MKCMTGSWRAYKLSVGAEGYDFMFCSLNQNSGWDGSGIIPLLPPLVKDIECTIDAEKQNLIIGHCCLERTFNALLKKNQILHSARSKSHGSVSVGKSRSYGFTLASEESGEANHLTLPWELPVMKVKVPKYRKHDKVPAQRERQSGELAFWPWDCHAPHCNEYAGHSVLFIGFNNGASDFLWGQWNSPVSRPAKLLNKLELQ